MKFKSIAGVLVIALACGHAWAQAYPNKPVTIIVPFAPGGGIDILTRALGAELGERWGRPLIVENRAGAGSLIGSSFVARAQPDGYTLLATVNQTMVGNRFLYKKLPYDPDKSFDPVIMMVKADQLIVANAGFPANTLKEAVALARAKPGTISFGSFGKGSQPHLMFSTINERESIDLLHIPYNGITPNLTAVASGEVQLGSGSAAVVLPFIQGGRVKPLAIAADARSAQFPNVPTTTEEGFPYAKVSIWYALFAPANTPADILTKIRTDVQAVLHDPQFVEKQITSKGLTVVAGDGRQLGETIKSETALTAVMVKAAGVVAE